MRVSRCNGGHLLEKKGGLYGLFFFALTSLPLPAIFVKPVFIYRISGMEKLFPAWGFRLREASFSGTGEASAFVESENSRYGCFRQRQKEWKVRRIVRSLFVS